MLIEQDCGKTELELNHHGNLNFKPGMRWGLTAIRVAVSAFLILLNTGGLLQAQNVVLTGAIGGQVTDPSGAVIPVATVVARDLETGVTQSVRTNRDGLYRFPVLIPGRYSVMVSAPGFRDLQATQQETIGNTNYQDARLQVGASHDTVVVTNSESSLRPGESSQSSVINRSFINDLPLDGRRYTDFTLLTPNSAPDGNTGLVSIAGQQGGEDSGYANGNGANVFSVDGTNATSNYFDDILGRYRIPYLYGENSVEEFQVAESPYSAIYGGGAGFINAVTRTGSNTLHGNAFYYNRDSAFGANNSLSKSAGYPKQQDTLQQFGASIGGPIWRNKFWFFFDYEEQRENDPISIINSSLVTSQPGFLLSNFGIPDGTPLPPPNSAKRRVCR